MQIIHTLKKTRKGRRQVIIVLKEHLWRVLIMADFFSCVACCHLVIGPAVRVVFDRVEQ